MNTRGGARPSFLYVGMPKAGSTWLYECLRAHPAIFVPDAKGLEFFDRNFERGVGWYLGKFAAAPSGAAIGELSHDTYACREAPERIRRLFPDMRLLLCLREPGDAARSILQWWCNHTQRYGATVSAMTAHPHFRALLAYADNLQRILANFPAPQVRVLFYEDLARDPLQFIRVVYEFLGVDQEFRPTSVGAVINAVSAPRSGAVVRLAYGLAGQLRSLGADRFVERAKASGLLRSVLYAGRRTKEIPPDIRDAARAVRRRSAPDYARIEAMIGRPVPVEWGRALTQP